MPSATRAHPRPSPRPADRGAASGSPSAALKGPRSRRWPTPPTTAWAMERRPPPRRLRKRYMRSGAARAGSCRPPRVSGHPSRACGGAPEKQVTLADVLRERCRALEFRARLVGAAEFFEQVTPRARQEVIRLERGLRHEPVDELEPRCRTERHTDRDRAIELNDR